MCILINKQYLPFEKNRYYYGKLLTTADLETEQKYISHKRQFINMFTLGQGKVCGLKVYKVNDDSIMLESGFAIDCEGREIIVGQSGIRKISSIEGFNSIKSDKMLLTIQYDESLTQPVYSIPKNSESKEFEYNKINENFKLVLKDLPQIPYNNNENIFENDLLIVRDIFKNEDFKISIKMPAIACLKSDFKIVIYIEKLSDSVDLINLNFILNIPGFIGDDGNEILFVNIKDLSLSKFDFHSLELWAKPHNVSHNSNTSFLIKKDDVKINIGNNNFIINENIIFQLHVSNNHPLEIVKSKVKNNSLENIFKYSNNNDVVLASISFIKTANNIIIQDVDIPNVSKYSSIAPAITPYEVRLLEYFNRNRNVISTKVNDNNNSFKISDFNADFKRSINNIISSGSFELPLGLNVKPNKTIVSDEIMHNLGPGDVCVNIAFDFVTNHPDKKDEYVRKIIFGDPEIFKSDGISFPSVSSAVQVLCEKGTFIVGLRFSQAISAISVKIRWFAFKQPEVAFIENNSNSKDKSIFVKQDTVRLIPNEIHFFEVGFKNMNPTPLCYEIIDVNGGQIDDNGCYTAPGKEGVYEIKISCINEPSIYTFAYAIVVKKDAE